MLLLYVTVLHTVATRLQLVQLLARLLDKLKCQCTSFVFKWKFIKASIRWLLVSHPPPASMLGYRTAMTVMPFLNLCMLRRPRIPVSTLRGMYCDGGLDHRPTYVSVQASFSFLISKFMFRSFVCSLYCTFSFMEKSSEEDYVFAEHGLVVLLV